MMIYVSAELLRNKKNVFVKIQTAFVLSSEAHAVILFILEQVALLLKTWSH